MFENIGDTKEDIEEEISDIEEQIIVKEIQSKEKSCKVISPTYESEKVTPSSTIKNKKLMHDLQREQDSSSSCVSSGEQIIIFNDQDLERKAFKLDDNLSEYEIETEI
jgi:hypothetical protein